jgi:MSHA pilin protein MshA
MVRSQKGFTLIELVMVIVILGILAAVAIPRYLNLQNEALDASFNGICGGLKSSAAILIASTPRGQLKNRATIRANTDVGTDVTLANSATSYAITMSYQGSTRDCTLGSNLSAD